VSLGILDPGEDLLGVLADAVLDVHAAAVGENAEEIFSWIENPKTHVYMCGLRGMEPGIDEAMTAAATAKGLNWAELRKFSGNSLT